MYISMELLTLVSPDTDQLRLHSEEGARIGFSGKQVIHPVHVPVVKSAFTPCPERVEWANALIESFEEHQMNGQVTVNTALFLLPLCSLLFLFCSSLFRDLKSNFISVPNVRMLVCSPYCMPFIWQIGWMLCLEMWNIYQCLCCEEVYVEEIKVY